MEEYLELRKVGVKKVFISRWALKKVKTFLPPNCLVAKPVRFFGIFLGMECDIVQKGYEEVFFTTNKERE